MSDRFVWDAGQFTITRPGQKGDAVGHEFHGNRWTGGIGGGGLSTTALRAHINNDHAYSNPTIDAHGGGQGANKDRSVLEDFHQHLHDEGADHAHPAPPAQSGLRPEVAARTTHVMEQLLQAEREGKATNMPPNEHDPRSPGRYSPERQAQHDAIVKQILDENKDVPAERKAWIMGGLGGAGKTSLLSAGAAGTSNEKNLITMPDGRQVGAEEVFGLRAEQGAGRDVSARITNAVNVNADDITERMAAAGMLPTVDHLAPMELSYLAHEEASAISHELADRAIAQGKNMVWDVTLGSRNSGSERIAQLKNQGYHVTGVFVDVSVETSVGAAMERYQRGYDDWKAGRGQGGRYVPPTLIEQGRDGKAAFSKNRLAFDSLVKDGQFDRHVIVNNEGRARRVESVG